MILSFADLKKYKFHYWFAFPAIHSEPAWVPSDISHDSVGSNQNEGNTKPPITINLTSTESSALVDAVQSWGRGVDACQKGFFLARKIRKSASEADIPANSVDVLEYDWEIGSLSSYENGFFSEVRSEDSYVCFADPSNYDSAPGWMLRNLLVFVKQRWGLDEVQILRYRDSHLNPGQGRSTILPLRSKHSTPPKSIESQHLNPPMPKVTGWERNAAGKLTGKVVDLTEYLDPKR
jgi:ubiquitin-like modifier-activating enzyme ATG7